jgi:hypothetical protein
MKKISLVFVSLLLVFSFFNCASTKGGIPEDAHGVWLKDVIAGGAVMEIALDKIAEADPDIDDDIIIKLLDDINQTLWEDPDYKLYWVESSSSEVTALSEKAAQVNASVILGKFSLDYLAASVKATARDATAENAVQEVMKEEKLTVSEQELLELKGKELSDQHIKYLKNSLVYMAVSVAALAKAPENAKELLEKAQSLAENPQELAESPTAVPKISSQLKSIIDNLNNVINDTPDVVKNLSANIANVVMIIKNK